MVAVAVRRGVVALSPSARAAQTKSNASKLKVAPIIQPRALSITQGRAVGVAHYLLGGIATTWSFFLARIISVG